MVFQGSINGHIALILLDLGANSNYVSIAFSEKTGIPRKSLESPVNVTTATGKSYPATDQLLNCDVRVVGTDSKMNLLVLPLGTYDAILGAPWYASADPKFNWKQWTCNGHAVYKPDDNRRVVRPRRTGRELYSMIINGSHKERTKALLTKYKDVFQAELLRSMLGTKKH